MRSTCEACGLQPALQREDSARCFRGRRGGANFYSGACVYVNEHESRAQPLQSGCSARVTRCLCTPVPANGFVLVFTNASTVLVTGSDIEQCCRMPLGGSKLVQPQRFSVVLSNAKAIVVHVAQAELRLIKVPRCSEPIKRNRVFVTPLAPRPSATGMAGVQWRLAMCACTQKRCLTNLRDGYHLHLSLAFACRSPKSAPHMRYCCGHAV
jgi:hypothetical protein